LSLLAQDERLTRRVGAVTLLLLAAAIAFMLVVYDRVEWGRHVRIKVYFHSVGALREGAPFIVAGDSIGDVETIALSPHGADTPLGGEHGIVVTVALEAKYADRVTTNGEIFVAARGPFGDRYLELAPPKEPGTPVANGDTFLGKDAASLDRVMQRTWDNLQITKQFAEELRPEVAELRTQVRALSATLEDLAPETGDVVRAGWDIAGVVAEAKKLRATLEGVDTSTMIGDARVAIAQARKMLDVLSPRAKALSASANALGERVSGHGTKIVENVELAIDRVRAALDKIEPIVARLDEINGIIARGEGSMMKLSRDPEFPEDAKELGKIMKRQPWKIIGRPPKNDP
jgi:ABC-type transporter Mla subunit MlaD